jgi:MFS family permease
VCKVSAAQTLPPIDDSIVVRPLLPIMASILAAFLIIGVALPVLPLHVHQGLGYGPFVVGLVAGSQFIASLGSRIWAGYFADTKGPKWAVVVGLVLAGVAGLLYFLSLQFLATPMTSVIILTAGRSLLGIAESFVITGGVSWGLSLVDARHSDKVIAWVGTAMFAALALGGPVGTLLFAIDGFTAIALMTTLFPLAVLLAVWRLPATKRSVPAASMPFSELAGAVWVPGIASALSSIGYGAILAFGSLLYADRGWHPIWIPFTAFAASLSLARLLFGHLPDRLGGARIALIFALLQVVGLTALWSSSSVIVATIGAAFTGFGYSLVYPALGVVGVTRVPEKSRGTAMGVYTVFLDVAMGFGNPLLGLLASAAGLGSVFLAGAVASLGAAAVALWLYAACTGRSAQMTDERFWRSHDGLNCPAMPVVCPSPETRRQ